MTTQRSAAESGCALAKDHSQTCGGGVSRKNLCIDPAIHILLPLENSCRKHPSELKSLCPSSAARTTHSPTVRWPCKRETSRRRSDSRRGWRPQKLAEVPVGQRHTQSYLHGSDCNHRMLSLKRLLSGSPCQYCRSIASSNLPWTAGSSTHLRDVQQTYARIWTGTCGNLGQRLVFQRQKTRDG
jgi:hypothetical protein